MFLTTNRPLTLIGWTITAAVALYLLTSAATKFLGTAATLAEFEHLGYSRSVFTSVAITVFAWTGLVLRDPLVRSVMPWRTPLARTVPESTPFHRSPEI